MPKLIRITTVPISLKLLLTGQMNYMKERGFDVKMVSAEGQGINEIIQNEGCQHIAIQMTREITPFKDLYSLWLLVCLFIKEKPDIVHSHTPKAGLLAMLAASLVGVPVKVHTIAGLRFMTTTGIKRKLLVIMEKITYAFADHVWANSASILSYMQQNKLCKPPKLDMIGKGSTNGIDLTRFSKSSLQSYIIEETKKIIRYSDANTYLLAVGRVVKDKGIEELVEVFVAIQQKQQHLQLVLVGPFEDTLDTIRPEIKYLIQNHSNIIHIHWSDRVEYFMHLAHLLVHPSHREGFPNVLLQAGAMECPIVCSDIAGNIDIVRHKETGILFEVQNKADLQQKLEYTLAHQSELIQYKYNLFLDVKEKFDRKLIQHKIFHKYLSLLNVE